MCVCLNKRKSCRQKVFPRCVTVVFQLALFWHLKPDFTLTLTVPMHSFILCDSVRFWQQTRIRTSAMINCQMQFRQKTGLSFSLELLFSSTDVACEVTQQRFPLQSSLSSLSFHPKWKCYLRGNFISIYLNSAVNLENECPLFKSLCPTNAVY